MNHPMLTILMPCLNEEATIGSAIGLAQKYVQKSGISAEILIADNGSTDRSTQIAADLGARVISVAARGYGSALRAGIASAHGTYIVMGDCDATYDFSNLEPFLQKLNAGYDLVMGNRFAGGIEKGAMPFSHRCIGVPFLSWAARCACGVAVKDFHCGLRAFRTDAAKQLPFSTTGMEFATELIVLFGQSGAKICEVPTPLLHCPVKRKPHLRALQDGWRHLHYIMFQIPKQTSANCAVNALDSNNSDREKERMSETNENKN